MRLRYAAPSERRFLFTDNYCSSNDSACSVANTTHTEVGLRARFELNSPMEGEKEICNLDIERRGEARIDIIARKWEERTAKRKGGFVHGVTLGSVEEDEEDIIHATV